MLRRGPDGRRVGRVGLKGLQAVHLQIRAGEKFEFEYEFILFVLWEVCILSHFVLIYRCRLSGCEFCDVTTAAAEGGNLF